VEELIGSAEKARIGEHLSTCDQCALRVEHLRETIEALKQNKEAFCPNPWELYDFARSGHDPHGDISLHVAECSSCSKELIALKDAASKETMPAELWSRLKERLPKSDPKQIVLPTAGWWHIFLGILTRFWKASAVAAGAVAAALLLVVVFYSPDFREPMVPKPKSLPQKTAFVVLFEDHKSPILQKQIESLYEALDTSTELKDRYSLASPSETSEVIESGKAPSHDRSSMIEGLRKHLNVSRALVVGIFPSGDKLQIRVELIDTITGKTLLTKIDENIKQDELAGRVGPDILNMLLPSTDQR
jgi:hypothetical protein